MKYIWTKKMPYLTEITKASPVLVELVWGHMLLAVRHKAAMLEEVMCRLPAEHVPLMNITTFLHVRRSQAGRVVVALRLHPQAFIRRPLRLARCRPLFR